MDIYLIPRALKISNSGIKLVQRNLCAEKLHWNWTVGCLTWLAVICENRFLLCFYVFGLFPLFFPCYRRYQRTYIKNLVRTKFWHCSIVSESVVICQLTLKMAEEIDFENWRISNFKGLIVDRVIWHIVVFHLLTSTYIPNFIGIGKTFCGQTDVWTDGHLRPTLLGRLFGVDLKTKTENALSTP